MPAKAAAQKAKSTPDEVFEALRKQVFLPHFKKTVVTRDDSKALAVESKTVKFRGKPLYLGGLRRGKNSVSCYLMSLYTCPELGEKLSPELAKRRQGMSCFNFSTIDLKLFAELNRMLRDDIARFGKIKDFDVFVQGRMQKR